MEESGKCGGSEEVERLRGCETRVKRFIPSWKLHGRESAVMYDFISTTLTHPHPYPPIPTPTHPYTPTPTHTHPHTLPPTPTHTHNHTTHPHLCLAFLTLCRNVVAITRTKTGEMRQRKSAPIRLNESPKYMHCPRRESILLPTPRQRSSSRTWRNCQIWGRR